MVTSADLIAQFEGYRDNPYWDVNAFRAGFGSDTTTLPDGTVVPIRQGMTVTREDSLRDLQRRINSEFRPSAMRAIGAETYNALAPQQQAVLDSLAYNYGAGAWGKGLSNVAAAVKTPGYEDDVAAIQALSSHNEGMNAKRRSREAEIYGGASFNGPAVASSQNALSPEPAQPQQIDPVALIEAAQRQRQAFQPQQQEQQQGYSYQMPMNALAEAVPQYDRTAYNLRRLTNGA